MKQKVILFGKVILLLIFTSSLKANSCFSENLEEVSQRSSTNDVVISDIKYISKTIDTKFTENILRKILADEQFSHDNKNLISFGFDKTKEQDYWAKNNLEFGLTMSTNISFNAEVDEEKYPFSMSFDFQDNSVVIYSNTFLHKNLQNGVRVLNKGESVRSIFPMVDDLNFFWGLPLYNYKELSFFGVGCFLDTSRKRKISFENAKFSIKGDVNASYYARKLKGLAEGTFLTPLNLYPSIIKSDSLFSMNPNISIRYQENKETKQKFDQEIREVELPIKIVFKSGFKQNREQIRSEFLAFRNLQISKKEQELLQKAFYELKLNGNAYCFSLIRGSVDKITYGEQSSMPE